MSVENIFSALGKYYSEVDENYLTESFVFLVNELLHREPLFGADFLNHICVVNNEFRFIPNETIRVSTQEVTEQGTPDIKISSINKLIYIEVKHDSPLGIRQISRYRKALESSAVPIKRVILLTRFAVDLDESEKPDKHIRWFEIYNYLASSKAKIDDPACIYLIDSFNSFLEAKQMTLQKVTWEYMNGLPAMINLINMIEVAVQSSGIDFYKTYPKSAGWDFKGFNLQNQDYWCGIYFNNPLVVTFEIMDKAKYDKNKLPKPKYVLQEGKKRLWFRLPLEEIHFFALDRDQQLDEIAKFMKTSHSEAEMMRTETTKDNPI